MPAKLTTPQDIQTKIARKKVSCPMGMFKFGKPKVELEGKLVCAVFINGILNTFPSVWDPEFEDFVIRYNPFCHPEAFLKVRILSKGMVEYPVGQVSVEVGSDQKTHILRLS